MNQACAAGISRVGTLAGALDPARLARLHLQAPGGASSAGLIGINTALKANGVSGLLHSLPFDSPSLAGMGQFSLLAGLLTTIHRTLGVNLLAPNAASNLTQKIQRISGGGSFQLVTPQIPNLSPSEVQRLTHLSSTALALKPLHIDLFHPKGVRDLHSWLSGPSVGATMSGLEKMPIRSSTITGLGNVAGVSLAAQFAHAAMNLGKPTEGVMPLMPALFSQLRAGKLTSLIAQLRTGQLAALLPALSAGGLPGTQIRLPGASQLANLNSQRAKLQLVQSATGLDPLDPRNSAKLSTLLKSLEGEGVCRTAQAAHMGDAHLNGLTRLTSLHSSLETVQTGTEIELLKRDAGAKLARTIGELQAHRKTLADCGTESASIIPALSGLAALGTAFGQVTH